MLGFAKEITYYWKSFSRLLYPERCALCGHALTLNEVYLCTVCLSAIKPLQCPLCLRCARSLPPFGEKRTICSFCRSRRPDYDHGFSLIPYDDNVKTLFHQIKFRKKDWLLNTFKPFLRAFADRLIHLDYDALVPVPLDSRRRFEREFNQAELIARMIRQISKLPQLRIESLLQKKKKTLPQSQLERTQRIKNLAGAFRVKRPASASGKKILIVDDIFTTGSTINECAKVLKEDGAEQVDFFTVARAQLT